MAEFLNYRGVKISSTIIVVVLIIFSANSAGSTEFSVIKPIIIISIIVLVLDRYQLWSTETSPQPVWRGFALFVLGVFVAGLLLSIANYILCAGFADNATQCFWVKHVPPADTTPAVWILGLVLTGIWEEGIFRSSILGWFRNATNINQRWLFIILSSFIFGSLHAFDSNYDVWVSVIAKSLSGVIFALLYLKWNSYPLVIGIHAMWNTGAASLVMIGSIETQIILTLLEIASIFVLLELLRSQSFIQQHFFKTAPPTV